MVFNLKRRARERAIAAEIANELYFAWKPAMEAGATADALMTEHRQTFAHVFAAACERHGLRSEVEATRVMSHLPSVEANLRRRFAKLNRQFNRATDRLEP